MAFEKEGERYIPQSILLKRINLLMRNSQLLVAKEITEEAELIEFTKRNQSVTYLVFNVSSMELVGYFTIALKSLTVRGKMVSNTIKKKLMRVSEPDEQSQTYAMSAYLMAQLGKNFTNSADKRSTGEELLEVVRNRVEEILYLAGGVVTFLEANNEDKQLDFYKNNRFQKFDTRKMLLGAAELHELVQLLRLL